MQPEQADPPPLYISLPQQLFVKCNLYTRTALIIYPLEYSTLQIPFIQTI